MPVVIADGVGIADALVFVVMLVLVAMLWLLLQARAPIAKVPVVGSTGVTLIDGLRSSIVALAHSLEAFLSAQQAIAGDLWARFVGQFIDGPIATLGAEIVSLITWERHAASVILPALQVGVADSERILSATVLPAIRTIEGDALALENYAHQVLAVELAGALSRLAAAEQELVNVRGQAEQLTAHVVAAEGALAVLAGYLPLLRTLGAFESVTAGGVGQLAGQLAGQAGRVQVIEQDLSKVLSLSAITALGAVAIENLIRVAKDPCSACEGINLNDQELRLEALEFFGES